MSIDMKDVRQLGVRAPDSGAGKAEKASGAAGGAAAARGAAGGVSGDSVSLTQAGVQLSQLDKNLAGQPAVDAKRVEQVRQRLQSGAYKIDPARVADKLLGFEFPAKS